MNSIPNASGTGDTSSLEHTIPLVDLAAFLSGNHHSIHDEAKILTSSLETYGAVLIRDPRVSVGDSDAFVDTMEDYFAQPTDAKMKDARPQYFYQVGATPPFTERPRDNSNYSAALKPEHMPVTITSGGRAAEKDPKWRYFWRIGKRPENTEFPQLNAEPVIPEKFAANWGSVMDSWGNKLLDTSHSVVQLLSIGLGLEKNTLSQKMHLGAHLLAPTGSNLSQLNTSGTVLAGYHYDISMLSLHGKSRYPGLYIWRSDGVKVPVVMPKGTLLVQSGIQIEYLTAGRIKRGMHEVVVSDKTIQAADSAAKLRPGNEVWRVSSTFFVHVHSDASLKPLIKNAGVENEYQDVKAGELVAQELRHLELAT